MVSGFQTKYQRTKCQKTGNRIEACQWIVARPRHLSCFTPQNGVKHDKIIFHEFFCVCNVFSFSLVSLSVTLSLSPLYLSPSFSVYLSHSFSLSLSLPLFLPVSLPIFRSRALQSLYLSLSHPSLSLSLLPPLSSPTHVSLFIVLSFSHPSLYFSLSVALSLSLYLPPPSCYLSFLSVTLPLLSLFLSFSFPYLTLFLPFLSLFLIFYFFFKKIKNSKIFQKYTRHVLL